MQKEIEALIVPVINDLGYVYWGCEYQTQNHSSVLAIYVDKIGGLTVEDCSQISRRLNVILEVEDLIKNRYRLEISSPGINRKLFYPHQYEAYVGKEIKAKLLTAIDARKNWTGTIIASNAQGIRLKVDLEELDIPFSQIMTAYLIIE